MVETEVCLFPVWLQTASDMLEGLGVGEAAKSACARAHTHTHKGNRKCDTVPPQPLISTQEQVGWRSNTVGRKQNVGAKHKGEEVD